MAICPARRRSWQYKSKSGYLGNDSFDFQVMDSEGRVSSATITINVNNSSPVGLAIYEPFNYAAGSDLNGKSGGGDVGFAGAVGGVPPSTVQAGSLGNGDILTKGGHIGNSKAKADRAISTAALADRGLLNDGATLWFSGYFGPDVGSSVSNGKFAFALANKRIPNRHEPEAWIPNEGSQPGPGLDSRSDHHGVPRRYKPPNSATRAMGPGFPATWLDLTSATNC